MTSTNATAIMGPLEEIYNFLYPGPNCEWLCIAATSTALVIVAIGFVVFFCVFAYICCSMPSRKAEMQMLAIREEMRAEWDEKKTRRNELLNGVRGRDEKKDDHKANGTDRSSSFFHVNFKERVRFEDQQPQHEDIEMQCLSSDGTNPLQRTVIVAPPHVVIEHSPSADDDQNDEVIDETAPLRRSPTYDEPPGDDDDTPVDDEKVALRRATSYDDVWETPRTSCASLILGRPLLPDGYLSDEEYLDARSAIYESREALADEDSDSDRTMTLTRE